MADRRVGVIAELKNEMSGSLKEMGADTDKLSTAMKVSAAAAVAAGVAMVALANKYGQLGAQIRDTAAGLDVSTDTLQALNYQFIQTGGGAETFSTAMRGMTSFMRTAAAGGAEQVGILNSLGMTYTELANMRPQDQFYAVTEALTAMGNGQKQAEAASALFGSRYSQRVLGTLRQTEGTLEDASRAFAEANLGISERDVMSLAHFSDQWTLMKQRVDAAMAEALLPVMDVLGRVMDNAEPLAAIIIGFTTAVLLNTGTLQTWGVSLTQAIAKLGTLRGAVGSLKTGLMGTMGLGIAISFTTGKLYELFNAMDDAHEANLSLADNLQSTADLLQTAVSTGFMSSAEAADSLDETFRQLIDDATLGAGEFIALNEIFQELRGTLSTTTINADLYTASLTGMSKGSYEAAIAQAQLQRTFAAGIFGADNMVTQRIDQVIANLQAMSAEAIRSAVELDKAFASTAGDGKAEGSLSLGLTPEMSEEARLEVSSVGLAIGQGLVAGFDEAMLYVHNEVFNQSKVMLGAARKAAAIKSDGIREEMALQQSLNNMMLSGAQNMGRILLSGADDWEEQMFWAIVKLGAEMALNMVVPGLGSFIGGLFHSGGDILFAHGGLDIPQRGAYGDRTLVAVERGERVTSAADVAAERLDSSRDRGGLTLVSNSMWGDLNEVRIAELRYAKDRYL